MERKLQRFEILEAAANAVYLAKDTIDDTTVQIYEWTPGRSRLNECIAKLTDMSEKKAIASEVFSAFASLYLVEVSPGSAKADLDLLRSKGLFTGNWLKDPPAAVVLPEVQPTASKGISVGALLASVVVCSLISCGVGATLESNGKVSQVDSDSARADLSTKLSNKQAELDQATQVQQQISQQLTELKSTYQGLHVLRVTNGCSITLKVAVRFKSYNDDMTNEGWLVLRPQQTSIAQTSLDPNFWIYARTESGAQEWYKPNGSAQIFIQNSDFSYTDGHQLPAVEDSLYKTPFLIKVDGPSYTDTLTCSPV